MIIPLSEYDYPLGLCVSEISEISAQAQWIKHLSKYMKPVNGSPNQNASSASPQVKRNSVSASPRQKRQSLGNLGLESSPKFSKRLSKTRTTSNQDSSASRDTRDSFIFPEVSKNDTLDSFDRTPDSVDGKLSREFSETGSFRNASVGYITPDPYNQVADPDPILSPTVTVNIAELIRKESLKENDEEEIVKFKEEGQQKTLELDDLDFQDRRSRNSAVAKWIDTMPVEHEDVEGDYFRSISMSWEDKSTEEEADSSDSDGSVDSIETDKWLGQSLSQSQRVDRVSCLVKTKDHL